MDQPDIAHDVRTSSLKDFDVESRFAAFLPGGAFGREARLGLAKHILIALES